jgi:hypothetical protein
VEDHCVDGSMMSLFLYDLCPSDEGPVVLVFAPESE